MLRVFGDYFRQRRALLLRVLEFSSEDDIKLRRDQTNHSTYLYLASPSKAVASAATPRFKASNRACFTVTDAYEAN